MIGPRRLTRTEKQKRLRHRRERKLSRSIHRSRMRAAVATKAQKSDFTPVTAKELNAVKLKLSQRQKKQSGLLSNELWQQADRREDFLHKLSRSVALAAEIIVMEDLHVAGMLANRNLAASLSDAALGRLAEMIDYKTERAGGLVLWAPRFFPSTKRCCECGAVHPGLDMSQREWTCDGCGVVHDRDLNAGQNLHWLGQLAVSLEKIPAAAAAWRAWILAARDQMARWRAKRAFSLGFFKSAYDMTSVGGANSEFTRGELGNRGGSDLARDPGAEPRSIVPQGSRLTFAH
jgi:IS605 OrfB family transposase